MIKNEFPMQNLRDFNQTQIGILRNAYEDLFAWTVNPSSLEELSEADSIAAFSFGFGPIRKKRSSKQYNPKYHFPGLSNDKIADLIAQFIKKNNRIGPEDIFSQQEIADSLTYNHSLKLDPNHIAIPSKDYLGTRGVADHFYDHGLGRYKNTALFAHPMHTYRCEKTLLKSAKDNGYEPTILIPDTGVVPFDEASLHTQTRNEDNWVLYEINSRAFARVRGHM